MQLNATSSFGVYLQAGLCAAAIGAELAASSTSLDTLAGAQHPHHSSSCRPGLPRPQNQVPGDYEHGPLNSHGQTLVLSVWPYKRFSLVKCQVSVLLHLDCIMQNTPCIMLAGLPSDAAYCSIYSRNTAGRSMAQLVQFVIELLLNLNLCLGALHLLQSCCIALSVMLPVFTGGGW